MAKYLGETKIKIEDSKFKNYSDFDWAMYFIESYGGIEGDEHKNWVLDQVARIYNGSKLEVKLAKWDNGEEEYRVSVLEPTEKYNNWVLEMRGYTFDENGVAIEPNEDEFYFYDEGKAP